MKITILGCGSAYGVPFAGGNWGDCDPENPRNKRLTPSILIEQDGSSLLVDMGPDFKEQSIRHEIREIDGVFFTHPHADHINGMYNLPVLMKYFQDSNLTLYADAFTRGSIEKNFWYMFDPSIKVEYSGPGRMEWHVFEPLDALEIGNINVTPFGQHHGNMTTMGLRIGDFAYSTDMKSFPDESLPYLEGLDLWILECNSETKESEKHCHLELSLEMVECFKPKKAILTHLDYTVDYDRVSAQLPDHVELAYDGLEINL